MNGVVIGCSCGNIGEYIANKLIFKCVTKNELDVTNDTDIVNFNWGDYDTFVFNQGVAKISNLEDYSFDEISNIIDVNLTGSIKCLSKIIKTTRKSIKAIFIGSMGHIKPLSGSIPYTASKAGLNMFVKNAAFELASKGHEIYCINPSAVDDTPMTNRIIKNVCKFRNMSEKEAVEYWRRTLLFDSPLSKHEICEVVNFIVSGKAKYLSGSPINLAGGQR